MVAPPSASAEMGGASGPPVKVSASDETPGTDSDSDCDAAVAAMEDVDSDLDPVWGLIACAQPAAAHCAAIAAEADEQLRAGADEPHRVCEPAPAEESHGIDEEAADVDSDSGASSEDLTVPIKPISAVVDKPEVEPSQFALPTGVSKPSVVRRDIEGLDGFVLDGVLSHEECAALISQADGSWSFWDNSEKPRVQFRNSHTVEVTHHDIADEVWRRVAPFVNSLVDLKEDDDRFECDIGGQWHPYGINPNLLLGHYQNGGHFAPHTDGTTVVDFNRRTFYTCLLYLNESPSGGCTKLYADKQMEKELVKDEEGRLTGDQSLVLEAVRPAAGRMLVFYHRLMHEGEPAANKYFIRTDVLYRREPEICTEKEDKEAFQLYQDARVFL